MDHSSSVQDRYGWKEGRAIRLGAVPPGYAINVYQSSAETLPNRGRVRPTSTAPAAARSIEIRDIQVTLNRAEYNRLLEGRGGSSITGKGAEEDIVDRSNRTAVRNQAKYPVHTSATSSASITAIRLAPGAIKKPNRVNAHIKSNPVQVVPKHKSHPVPDSPVFTFAKPTGITIMQLNM